jgi:hypothetical protein
LILAYRAIRRKNIHMNLPISFCNIFLSVALICSFKFGVSPVFAQTQNKTQTWSLRIPGTKLPPEDPIRFDKSLKLEPELVDVGFTGDSMKPSWFATTPDGGKYKLKNYETVVNAPIHLEYSIVTDSEGQATVGIVTPDSMAAWNRLKTWPEMSKISQAAIREIDQGMEALRTSTQNYLSNKSPKGSDEKDLIETYKKLQIALGAAFDQTKDFEVQRNLSVLIAGARNERLAWELRFRDQSSFEAEDKHSVHK